jgi:hypothetical protein
MVMVMVMIINIALLEALIMKLTSTMKCNCFAPPTQFAAGVSASSSYRTLAHDEHRIDRVVRRFLPSISFCNTMHFKSLIVLMSRSAQNVKQIETSQLPLRWRV